MVRSLPVLLSFALLACPLNCMGTLCGDSSSERDIASVSSVGCGCCPGDSSRKERDADGAPRSPDDRCQCLDCFCKGALSGDETRDAEDRQLALAGAALLGNLPCASPPLTSPTPTIRSFEVSTFSPSGRCARIWHQSLLL